MLNFKKSSIFAQSKSAYSLLDYKQINQVKA